MADKIKVFCYVDVGTTPTPLHDGTNAAGQPNPNMSSFLIQATADTYFGDSALTGAADGVKTAADCERLFESEDSRGTPKQYNLRQIYYTGGPFKMVVDTREDADEC